MPWLKYSDELAQPASPAQHLRRLADIHTAALADARDPDEAAVLRAALGIEEPPC